jgi:hypothetical protein
MNEWLDWCEKINKCILVTMDFIRDFFEDLMP